MYTNCTSTKKKKKIWRLKKIILTPFPVPKINFKPSPSRSWGKKKKSLCCSGDEGSRRPVGGFQTGDGRGLDEAGRRGSGLTLGFFWRQSQQDCQWAIEGWGAEDRGSGAVVGPVVEMKTLVGTHVWGGKESDIQTRRFGCGQHKDTAPLCSAVPRGTSPRLINCPAWKRLRGATFCVHKVGWPSPKSCSGLSPEHLDRWVGSLVPQGCSWK